MKKALRPLTRRAASFVSTARPAPSQRKAAVVVAILSLVVFALAAPFAKVPLAPVTAFVPIYQSSLIVFDVITCVLLYGQYRMLRSCGLLLLASGYMFSALMATAHALSFPGLFAPAGAIGGGAQTTAWLYFFWHTGFAVFVLAYAVTSLRTEPASSVTFRKAIAGSIALAMAAAAVFFIATTTFHDSLPSIMRGDLDAPRKVMVAMATWLVGIAALAVLWRRRPHTVLDLWLMVVMCVWIADTALAAVLNHGRFDVGWYAGRVYGLLANGFVLGVLLLESGTLYARLAKSNRLLENALVEMRRLNGDLQAFAGTLAHDLQQPLTTISAFAQMIHASELPQRETAHLERIMGATESARSMIKALLEFARLGEAELQSGPVPLDAIVDEARSALSASTQGRDIEWRVAPLPVVHGDSSLLLLTFINLLSNAVKYTRQVDHAVISVECEARSPGWHAVRIRDNGVGFDMAHAARLFTPFERLHPLREFEGTGMGLANVRKIVERHGGSITADAQPGGGATFVVVLRDAAVQPQGTNGVPMPNSSMAGVAVRLG